MLYGIFQQALIYAGAAAAGALAGMYMEKKGWPALKAKFPRFSGAAGGSGNSVPDTGDNGGNTSAEHSAEKEDSDEK